MNLPNNRPSKPRVPCSTHGRRATETSAQRNRRYFLAYLSCGLTPRQARALQRRNLARARALIAGAVAQ